MADENKKTLEDKIEAAKAEAPVKTDAPAKNEDIAKAKAHLEKLAAELIENFAGKPDHNPYLWIAKNIQPLEVRLNIAPVLVSSVERALALRKETPVVSDPAVEPRIVPASRLVPQAKNSKPISG